MAYNSEIAWTDATWNPFRGCTRISPGCQNCYAERMAARGLPGLNSPTSGKPFAILMDSGPRWTGDVEIIESQMDAPLRWRKPRRIFVNSMSDTWHAGFSYQEQTYVASMAVAAERHTYLFLTKRAAIAREFWVRFYRETRKPWTIVPGAHISRGRHPHSAMSTSASPLRTSSALTSALTICAPRRLPCAGSRWSRCWGRSILPADSTASTGLLSAGRVVRVHGLVMSHGFGTSCSSAESLQWHVS